MAASWRHILRPFVKIRVCQYSTGVRTVECPIGGQHWSIHGLYKLRNILPQPWGARSFVLFLTTAIRVIHCAFTTSSVKYEGAQGCRRQCYVVCRHIAHHFRSSQLKHHDLNFNISRDEAAVGYLHVRSSNVTNHWPTKIWTHKKCGAMST